MSQDENKKTMPYLDRFKEKVVKFALGSSAALDFITKIGSDGIKKSSQRLKEVVVDQTDMMAAVTKALDKAFKQTKHNPNFRKALAHIFTAGSSKEQKAARVKFKGEYNREPPGFLVISPTKACNLKCIGCYAISSSSAHEKLDWDVFDRAITEKTKLWGSNFTVISGGEPFMYKSDGKDLLDMVEKHDDNFFLVFTNGTLINKERAARMAKLGNITPAISVEGYEKETDCRRGEGVHKKILEAMQNLKEAGVMFGVSITAIRDNAEIVTEDKFYDYYMNELGATYAWIFQYMPIGREQTLDLQVTPEQRMAMWRKTRNLVKKGVFVADFWNSACVTSGCLSAAKEGGYLYIDWNGNIAPCVFNPYAPLNINDVYKENKTLNDVAAHPFFADIRKWQAEYVPEGQPEKTGNLLLPCAIRDHYANMKELLNKHHPKPLDESAAEALEDEDYIQGLNKYDEELAKLMDPIWKEEYLDKG